ncbi:MAG: NTP transferase domain-containing protein [Pseudomonadota bacterium]
MIKDLLIIAAGKGTRLKDKGDIKPLVEVAGKTLIERILHTAFSVGISRATVVIGYKSQVLEPYLQSLSEDYGWPIKTVFNPQFEQPNGLSVAAARPYLTGDFVLTMCDHILDEMLLQRLLSHSLQPGQVALGVDTRLNNPMVDLEDVTKVQKAGSHIRDIGKHLTHYNAFDTGAFLAAPALFDAIEQSGKTHSDYSISGGMKILAQNNSAIAVDIGDALWIDVDSPEMHTLAERVLQDKPHAAAR